VETGGVVFKEVVSLTTLHAGESRNVVPGVLRANVNFRYGPDRTPEDAERFARGLCPSSPGVECRRVDHAPPGAVPRNAPLYRHLIESSGLPCRAKQAWTDVARFSQVGVPALNWGPGDPHAAHTNEESIEVSDLEETLARMREFFLGPGPDLEGDA
jgi:succinyl-diaminopimelate desuccinylase